MSERADTRFKSGALTDEVRTSPVDRHQLRFRRIVLVLIAAVIVIAACAVALHFVR